MPMCGVCILHSLLEGAHSIPLCVYVCVRECACVCVCVRDVCLMCV